MIDQCCIRCDMKSIGKVLVISLWTLMLNSRHLMTIIVHFSWNITEAVIQHRITVSYDSYHAENTVSERATVRSAEINAETTWKAISLLSSLQCRHKWLSGNLRSHPDLEATTSTFHTCNHRYPCCNTDITTTALHKAHRFLSWLSQRCEMLPLIEAFTHASLSTLPFAKLLTLSWCMFPV